MPQPMICLNADVCQCAERFRSAFSTLYDESVVAVLRGQAFTFGDDEHSRSTAQREWAASLSLGVSVGCSCIGSHLAGTRPSRDAAVGEGCMRAETPGPTHMSMSTQRSLRVMTGYLMGDASTMRKQMEGQGKHHSITHEQRIVGHHLVQGRSVLLDRRCSPVSAGGPAGERVRDRRRRVSEHESPDGDADSRGRARCRDENPCGAEPLVLRHRRVECGS